MERSLVGAPLVGAPSRFPKLMPRPSIDGAEPLVGTPSRFPQPTPRPSIDGASAEGQPLENVTYDDFKIF